jgi:HK97 family phage prohead protease
MNDTLQFTSGFQIKRESVTETGTFSGYASVFNQIDAGGDRIAPGAYKETLREWKGRGKLPPMLLQHGGFVGPAEDGIPIGVWDSMEEDAKGLKVTGRLYALDTDKGRYIHEGLKAGTLDGLSIGYIPRKVAIGQGVNEPRRTLLTIELREVSVVTFPMDQHARISAAKGLHSARDLERALRQAGFTQNDAKRITAGGWQALSKQTPNQLTQATALLRARTAELLKEIRK